MIWKQAIRNIKHALFCGLFGLFFLISEVSAQGQLASVSNKRISERIKRPIDKTETQTQSSLSELTSTHLLSDNPNKNRVASWLCLNAGNLTLLSINPQVCIDMRSVGLLFHADLGLSGYKGGVGLGSAGGMDDEIGGAGVYIEYINLYQNGFVGPLLGKRGFQGVGLFFDVKVYGKFGLGVYQNINGSGVTVQLSAGLQLTK